MINAILILLFVHYLSLYIFKPKNKNLSCGIFGHIADNVNKIDSNAVKILGILNESRGENSCGLTIDSDIFHGVNEFKKFRDFAKGSNFKPELKPVVFGHTRKSSVGLVNRDNAHPFGFGTSLDGGYEFIGAHNGTLYNYEEMAEEYGVSLTAKDGDTVRNKIDSEILLESIYKSKSFKPLSFYNGGAALVWYTPDTDTVYLFSGASKSYDYATAVPSIERPLHVWLIDKNEFMFSSEKEPLETVGGTKDNVFQIESNTVYVIKNGDFEGAEKFKISRNERLQKKQHTTSYHNSGTASRLPANRPHDQKGTQTYEEKRAELEEAFRGSGNARVKTTQSTSKIINLNPSSKELSANHHRRTDSSEIVDFVKQNEYRGRLFVRNLRYYKNGHPAETGVYLNIRYYGLFKVGDDYPSASSFLRTHKESLFNIESGSVCINKDQKEDVLHVKAFSDCIISPNLFTYIFKGYALETYLDFTSTMSDTTRYLRNNEFNYASLSHITRYPVLNSKTANGTYLKAGLPVVNMSVSGPNFDYVLELKSGIPAGQREIEKPYLKGLDIANEINQKKTDEILKSLKSNGMYYMDGSMAPSSDYSRSAVLRRELLNANTKEVITFPSKEDIDAVEIKNTTVEIFSEIETILDMIDTAYDDFSDLAGHYQNIDPSYFIDDVEKVLTQFNTSLKESVFEIVEAHNTMVVSKKLTLEQSTKIKRINSLLLSHM